MGGAHRYCLLKCGGRARGLYVLEEGGKRGVHGLIRHSVECARCLVEGARKKWQQGVFQVADPGKAEMLVLVHPGQRVLEEGVLCGIFRGPDGAELQRRGFVLLGRRDRVGQDDLVLSGGKELQGFVASGEVRHVCLPHFVPPAGCLHPPLPHHRSNHQMIQVGWLTVGAVWPHDRAVCSRRGRRLVFLFLLAGVFRGRVFLEARVELSVEL